MAFELLRRSVLHYQEFQPRYNFNLENLLDFQFVHRHVPHFNSVVRNHRRAPNSLIISCSRRTEQEDDLSTSDKDRSGIWHLALGLKDGVGKASEFFFNWNRVLTYGIDGAIIFRFTLILLGSATLQKFEAVNLLLAAILLYSSFKLFASEEEETDLSNNFVVKTCQRFIPITANYDGNRFITSQDGIWKPTPLLLTVAVIELSDIAFAVDSIPAVFGVARDPFIVLTSLLFWPSIAVVLGFIGCKMILDFFGAYLLLFHI